MKDVIGIGAAAAVAVIMLTSPSAAYDVEAEFRPMLKRLDSANIAVGTEAKQVASNPQFYSTFKYAFFAKDQFETADEYRRRLSDFKARSARLMQGIYAFRVKPSLSTGSKFLFDPELKRAYVSDFWGGALFELDVKIKTEKGNEVLRNNYGASVPIESITEERTELGGASFGSDSLSLQFSLAGQEARAAYWDKEFLIVGTFPEPSPVVNNGILYVHREMKTIEPEFSNPIRVKRVTYNAQFDVRAIYILDLQKRVLARGEFKTCGMGNGVGANACSDWRR